MSILSGLSSWFGGPNDPTSGPTTASGAPVTTPGIAVYNRSTLGGWWLIKAPNGAVGLVRQTDIGPAPWTGRKFDYTYSLLPLFGYSQKTFPTGSTTRGVYLGKNYANIGQQLNAGLQQLGATPAQSATMMGALDQGAIMQGSPAIVSQSGQQWGQTNTAGGALPSASEATSAGISLPGISSLGDLWNSILSDAKYAGLLVVALLVGAFLIIHGISGGNTSKIVAVPR